MKKIHWMVTGIALLAANTALGEQKSFSYYVSGNPDDVATTTRALVVMQGGGDDVDENYVQMGAAAGGGDFVVLRASGTNEYNDYVLALCECDSVETIVFHNRDAGSDPFVVETIRNAEAIFIGGGDQSNYVRYWKDTPVEDAIHDALSKPAAIGGTSAGMAVLGGYTYSAMSPNSLQPEVALADPYHDDVTIETDFLQVAGMQGIITDQHLVERDRIGRTITFLARLMRDGVAENPRAIAADRETSLHLDPATGDAFVFTTANHETPYVYFLQGTAQPNQCEAGKSLIVSDIEVYRLAPGGHFNVFEWQGSGGIAYRLNASNGALSSSRAEIY